MKFERIILTFLVILAFAGLSNAAIACDNLNSGSTICKAEESCKVQYIETSTDKGYCICTYDSASNSGKWVNLNDFNEYIACTFKDVTGASAYGFCNTPLPKPTTLSNPSMQGICSRCPGSAAVSCNQNTLCALSNCGGKLYYCKKDSSGKLAWVEREKVFDEANWRTKYVCDDSAAPKRACKLFEELTSSDVQNSANKNCVSVETSLDQECLDKGDVCTSENLCVSKTCSGKAYYCKAFKKGTGPKPSLSYDYLDWSSDTKADWKLNTCDDRDQSNVKSCLYFQKNSCIPTSTCGGKSQQACDSSKGWKGCYQSGEHLTPINDGTKTVCSACGGKNQPKCPNNGALSQLENNCEKGLQHSGQPECYLGSASQAYGHSSDPTCGTFGQFACPKNVGDEASLLPATGQCKFSGSAIFSDRKCVCPGGQNFDCPANKCTTGSAVACPTPTAASASQPTTSTTSTSTTATQPSTSQTTNVQASQPVGSIFNSQQDSCPNDSEVICSESQLCFQKKCEKGPNSGKYFYCRKFKAGEGPIPAQTAAYYAWSSDFKGDWKENICDPTASPLKACDGTEGRKDNANAASLHCKPISSVFVTPSASPQPSFYPSAASNALTPNYYTTTTAPFTFSFDSKSYAPKYVLTKGDAIIVKDLKGNLVTSVRLEDLFNSKPCPFGTACIRDLCIANGQNDVFLKECRLDSECSSNSKCIFTSDAARSAGEVGYCVYKCAPLPKELPQIPKEIVVYLDQNFQNSTKYSFSKIPGTPTNFTITGGSIRFKDLSGQQKQLPLALANYLKASADFEAKVLELRADYSQFPQTVSFASSDSISLQEFPIGSPVSPFGFQQSPLVTAQQQFQQQNLIPSIQQIQSLTHSGELVITKRNGQQEKVKVTVISNVSNATQCSWYDPSFFGYILMSRMGRYALNYNQQRGDVLAESSDLVLTYANNGFIVKSSKSDRVSISGSGKNFDIGLKVHPYLLATGVVVTFETPVNNKFLTKDGSKNSCFSIQDLNEAYRQQPEGAVSDFRDFFQKLVNPISGIGILPRQAAKHSFLITFDASKKGCAEFQISEEGFRLELADKASTAQFKLAPEFNPLVEVAISVSVEVMQVDSAIPRWLLISEVNAFPPVIPAGSSQTKSVFARVESNSNGNVAEPFYFTNNLQYAPTNSDVSLSIQLTGGSKALAKIAPGSWSYLDIFLMENGKRGIGYDLKLGNYARKRASSEDEKPESKYTETGIKGLDEYDVIGNLGKNFAFENPQAVSPDFKDLAFCSFENYCTKEDFDNAVTKVREEIEKIALDAYSTIAKVKYDRGSEKSLGIISETRADGVLNAAFDTMAEMVADQAQVAVCRGTTDPARALIDFCRKPAIDPSKFVRTDSGQFNGPDFGEGIAMVGASLLQFEWCTSEIAALLSQSARSCVSQAGVALQPMAALNQPIAFGQPFATNQLAGIVPQPQFYGQSYLPAFTQTPFYEFSQNRFDYVLNSQVYQQCKTQTLEQIRQFVQLAGYQANPILRGQIIDKLKEADLVQKDKPVPALPMKFNVILKKGGSRGGVKVVEFRTNEFGELQPFKELQVKSGFPYLSRKGGKTSVEWDGGNPNLLTMNKYYFDSKSLAILEKLLGSEASAFKADVENFKAVGGERTIRISESNPTSSCNIVVELNGLELRIANGLKNNAALKQVLLYFFNEKHGVKSGDLDSLQKYSIKFESEKKLVITDPACTQVTTTSASAATSPTSAVKYSLTVNLNPQNVLVLNEIKDGTNLPVNGLPAGFQLRTLNCNKDAILIPSGQVGLPIFTSTGNALTQTDRTRIFNQILQSISGEKTPPEQYRDCIAVYESKDAKAPISNVYNMISQVSK